MSRNVSKNILFIIDPQQDFHPGGSLGVPGANEDSQRIAEFIYANINNIDEIYVSLDSHHRLHIAHSVFWKNANGENPAPFTLIKHEDVANGTWLPVDSSQLKHALAYTKALESKGRFVVCVWPEHCLIGTPGHAVVPVLNEALQEWVKRNMKTVAYIHKGTNCLTEMYSALAAEVPILDDQSTTLNVDLLQRLQQAHKLFICGEAKSHCVNYTMRDIAANWGADFSRLILLEDCTSSVPGFDAAAQSFVDDMKNLGCTITNVGQVKL